MTCCQFFNASSILNATQAELWSDYYCIIVANYMQSILRLAVLMLCLLRKSNSSGTPTVCMIENVLVDSNIDAAGTSKTEVDIRSLAYCHNHETVANTLKDANPEKTGNAPTMHTRLTHPNYGALYRNSCRRGLLKSIYTKDDSNDSNGQNMKKV